MGERNSILLENDGIYLYSHWDTAGKLKKKLITALKRGRDRWDDRTYLNRIIFSAMIEDDIKGETGYGLGKDMYGGQVVLIVDVENNKVNIVDAGNNRVNGMSFEEFIKFNGMSFEEFIK